MRASVPEGWSAETLGPHLSVCRNGLVCPQDGTPDTGVPISRIETISTGRIDWNRVGYVPVEHADASYLLHTNDILLSHINSVAHIGKVARFVEERPLLHGMNLLLLRFGETVDPRFGYQLLSWRRTKGYFERRAKKAVNQASVNQQDVRALPIDLPPLPEQRAIAAVLDAVDDTIERNEAVIAATEDLRRALLHELLTRGVPGMHSEWKHVPGLGTVPACWDVTTLGELLSELRYGTSTKLSSQGEWPVLRIPNVAQGFVDLAELKYADLTEREADSLELQPGDLLIVRTNGNPDICGASAVWQGAEGRWAFASYLLRLRARAATLNSTFLWMYLRSVAGRTQLAGSIRTSAGNYNLSAGGLRAMLVPVPSLEEQNLMQGIVQGFDATEMAERDALNDAKMLKAALADALLSGRVQHGAAFNA